MYSIINAEGAQVYEKGAFRISIGGSLPGSRSENLGSAKTAQAVFTIK
jgi:hypothetical protein